MPARIWELTEGSRPLVATAIHNGHAVRDEVEKYLALDAHARRREEDPYTGRLARVAPTRVVGSHSRFEVDLNRPRDQAVYVTQEQAWGLKVWRDELPEDVVERSLARYDVFYERMRTLFDGLTDRHGRFVVFDIHSYNYRRGGLDADPADPELNPEVNVGTGTMDRGRWAPVVDAFKQTLQSADVRGHQLDVRENVKFQGGYFPEWIHETYPQCGCALAIEFKKTFMDEWSGELDEAHLKALEKALQSTVAPVLEALEIAG